MSLTNKKRGVGGNGGSDESVNRLSVAGAGATAGAGSLVGSTGVERLESEERAAVRRGDWAAAGRAAVEKAALKEALHRAAAGKVGR